MRFVYRAVLLFVALACIASMPRAAEVPARVWIFFKDRPYLKQSFADPRAGYTAGAIARRQYRGAAPWGPSDMPVDPGYRQRVVAAGATILVESRWLNAVSALCDSGCRGRLSILPYVSAVRPVAVFRRRAERIEPVRAVLEQSPVTGAALNYGQSLPQLQQLNVPAMHSRGFSGQLETIAIFDSGFRIDHAALRTLDLVAQRDFVFDDSDVNDGPEADSHGTSTWSCVGGKLPGELYGPAFGSRFLLAVTEDIRSETVIEEDNWVAALEWADRLGAGIVSSSLGYSNWYTPSDFNGRTAITSRAASAAAGRGIVVVNSIGNEGPDAGTLSAPADAYQILAVGAVQSDGTIAGFSSRGPTADGRIKPEVVARGVATFVATDFGVYTLGRASGTSFSCPLVAGTAAVLLSARPDWTPAQVREALMKTANRASTPDNNYGYGIPNVLKAFNYLPLRSIVFDHRPLPDTYNHSTPYLVSARIRAQRGVNPGQVFLYWKSANSAYHPVRMTPAPAMADRYQARIPAQLPGPVSYYMTARDTAGKLGRLPYKPRAFAFTFVVK